MSIYEYDEELHKRTLRREGYEDGFEDGENSGKTQILDSIVGKKLQKGYTISEIAVMLEQNEDIIVEIVKDIKKI